MGNAEVRFYVCPRCLTPYDQPGPCENCGIPRVECQPGAEGDPLRRPPEAPDGTLVAQAPAWWLRRTAGGLVDRYLRRSRPR